MLKSDLPRTGMSTFVPRIGGCLNLSLSFPFPESNGVQLMGQSFHVFLSKIRIPRPQFLFLLNPLFSSIFVVPAGAPGGT